MFWRQKRPSPGKYQTRWSGSGKQKVQNPENGPRLLLSTNENALKHVRQLCFTILKLVIILPGSYNFLHQVLGIRSLDCVRIFYRSIRHSRLIWREGNEYKNNSFALILQKT